MAKTEVEEGKVSVNADLENYTKAKAASGASSVNNGDEVATLLTGMNLDEVYEVAQEFADTEYDYTHLNSGMARMNLGNRIRGFLTKSQGAIDKARDASDKANAALVEDGKKAKPFKEPKAPITVLEAICKPIRVGVNAREKVAVKEAEVKAKAAADKEAATKKAAEAKKVKKAA